MGIFVILGYSVYFSRDLESRRHHSTTTAVFKVTEDIRLNLEDGQATVLVILDFTQVFDMIAHDLRGSQKYSDGVIALLGWKQCVRSDSEYSTVRGIEYGVPQGSVLGPLLFISFIDDVSGVIHFCRFQIYADDLQIYQSSSVADLQRFYDGVNTDLKRIYD
jgi:retron-type reverse transcriptase